MKRNDFQVLAALRLEEAKALLRAGCPDGAYYLAGYAVECALKACIAKQTERFTFPDLEKVKESWIHNLHKLIATAGLAEALKTSVLQPEFDANWKVVRQWNERSRYERRSLEEASVVSAK